MVKQIPLESVSRAWILGSSAVAVLTLGLIALSLGGIWELFPGGAHRPHLLGVFLALLSVALIVLIAQFFGSRAALSDARVSHDRLRLALLAANSVGWDLDVKSGRDLWFGDLKTVFGIPSDTASVREEDFYRYVHPDDRARVSEAVHEARDDHSLYAADFRVVHDDGTIRWVSATGEFQYNKKGEPVRMLGIAVDTTERRQSHEALIQSEEKFAKAFRVSPVPLTLTSARDHRYLEVNEAFERASGWSREEVIGKTPLDINLWVNPAGREETVKLVLAKKSIRDLEVHYRRKDGSLGVGLIAAETIDIDGETCIHAAIMDITDRKQAEDTLRRKDNELAEAQRVANLGTWYFDVKNSKITWSEELYRIHGLDPNLPPPSYEECSRLFTPDSWQRLRTTIEVSIKSGTVSEVDLELIRPDGTRRWVSARGYALRDSAGEVVSLHGTAQDITDRRRSAELLRQSKARLAAVVTSAMDAIIAVDDEQRIVLFNTAAEKMFRCPASEAVGSRIDRFIPLPFRAEQQTHVFRFGRTGVTSRSIGGSGKLYALRSDGEVFPMEASISQTEDDTGQKLFTVIIRDITERIRTEQVLRESEERFRRVVEHIGDALMVDDIEGHVIFANDRFLRLFGLSREQLPNCRLEDYVAPEYKKELRDRHDRRVRRESVPSHFEYEGIRPDGSRMWLEVDVVPVEDSEGKIIGTQSAIQDITERKRAEQAVEQSAERLRHLIDSSNDWVWEVDANGVYTYAGPQCRDILGYEPKELIGKTPFELMPPDESLRVAKVFNAIAAERKPFRLLKNINVHKDGHPVVLETNGVPVFDKDGTFHGYRGLDRDITERDRSEQALRESEERFRRVVEHIGDALVVDDAEGRVVFANDQFLSLFGFSRDDIGRITLADYVAPDRRIEHLNRHHNRMLGEDVTAHFEFEGLRHDGSRLWLDAEVVPIHDQKGKVVGSQKSLRDITERKRADQALRESEGRFRLVANTAPVLIWMSGTDNLCNYFNQPWLDFTGRSLEEELGDGWTEGVHAEDVERSLNTADEAFARREPFEVQYRLKRHDGEYRWILDTGVPRFNPDGTFAGYIGSCMDITERKLAEEAMATIGRRLIEAHEEERTWIGRELHDDINQRLALLAVELDQLTQHANREVSERVRHAQERITQIARDVQRLSHRLHSSKLEYLGLARAANSFCKELSEQTKVEVDFSHEDVPRTLPKEVSLCLFRVLQEALQNAVKYSGVSHFKVDLRGTPESIELTVADTGSGFEEQEAFTRHGLGLISMRERLQLVHGELSVKSKPGAGTTIYARVPLESDEYGSMVG